MKNRVNFLLLAILFFAFFLRVYRLHELLGFYFDQGRDALVIWNLWHKFDLFLVGPTTGIAGILRGPFYYYLIAPLYLISGGDPVLPTIFLAATTVLAIALLYYLGAKIQDKTTGLIAAFIAAFSFQLVVASRWLSNPTPMLILSVILVWMMILVAEGKRWAWAPIALASGLSLFSFGSSGELFWFPALLLFAIWQRKFLPDKKVFLASIALFALTFLPLVVFDIRNAGILRGNIKSFLLEEGSFAPPYKRFVKDKMEFYYNSFSSKLFHGVTSREKTALGLLVIAFLVSLPALWKKTGAKILLLLLLAPAVGLTFFRGNLGIVYDYYLTGYYLPAILAAAVVLGNAWKYKLGKLFVAFFLYLFIVSNTQVLDYRLDVGIDGEGHISLGNQLQAINWVFDDSRGQEFNVDVYVPPVIPYAYDYLFLWRAQKRCGQSLCNMQQDKQVPLLYTLYEEDPPHPERLDAWLARQKGIGTVEESSIFGGITVERRKRL